MDGGLLHPGSKSVPNPQLNLFTVPPTDLNMSSYLIITHSYLYDRYQPMAFQVDPQFAVKLWQLHLVLFKRQSERSKHEHVLEVFLKT